MPDKQTWFDALIRPGGRGIEIGPLHHPVIDKHKYDVKYVDHASTDELRRKYAADSLLKDQLGSIQEVDFVWSGDMPLAKVVGDDYDWVVASHVLEHVPDPIGWLSELSEVLVDGGLVLLALPDKRYCFDVNRSVTEVSDLVDCHLSRLRAPSFRHIYDFWSKIVPVDTLALWRGEVDYSGAVRTDVPDPDRDAYERCLARVGATDYADVHCHVFTPASFLELYEKLARLGLIDLKVAAFQPTEVNSLEFYVALEKLPRALGAAARTEAQLASIPRDLLRKEQASTDTALQSMKTSSGGTQKGSPSQEPGVATRSPGREGGGAWSRPEALSMEVSPRERALILGKRRVLGPLRSWLTRMRELARAGDRRA